LEGDSAEAQALKELLDLVHSTVGHHRIGIISPIQNHDDEFSRRFEIAQQLCHRRRGECFGPNCEHPNRARDIRLDEGNGVP